MPNFVSFAAFSAQLDHGGKSHTHSITHPAYLMHRESLQNKNAIPYDIHYNSYGVLSSIFE